MESHMPCQNPDLDSELIRLCIRVLEKLDYLGIGSILSNQIEYSSKTNGYLFHIYFALQWSFAGDQSCCTSCLIYATYMM